MKILKVKGDLEELGMSLVTTVESRKELDFFINKALAGDIDISIVGDTLWVILHV